MTIIIQRSNGSHYATARFDGMNWVYSATDISERIVSRKTLALTIRLVKAGGFRVICH